MTHLSVEAKMTENEVSYRNLNRQLVRSFAELEKMAQEDNQQSLVVYPSGFLMFMCECADMQCQKRVKMTLKTWVRIHKSPKRFCVYPGHVVGTIEKPIERHRHYVIIEKFDCPNQEPAHLWRTKLHFS